MNVSDMLHSYKVLVRLDSKAKIYFYIINIYIYFFLFFIKIGS